MIIMYHHPSFETLAIRTQIFATYYGFDFLLKPDARRKSFEILISKNATGKEKRIAEILTLLADALEIMTLKKKALPYKKYFAKC